MFGTMKPQKVALMLALLFQVVILPQSLLAMPKVAMLISLDPDENRPPLRFKSWDINEKLEKKYRKGLKKIGAELVVKTFAEQSDLYSLLNDEEVKAIFWVGHAGFTEGQYGPITSIIDYNGRNLEAVFQMIPPHLKFLGLVGCRGQKFIDLWKTKGWPENNNSLVTYSREKKTDARVGLRKAMKKLKKVIKENPNFLVEENKITCVEKELVKVSVRRSSRTNKPLSSALLMQKNKVVAVLPAAEGIEQVREVFLNEAVKKSDLKLVLDSGYTSLVPDSYEMGELEINAQAEWKLFAKRDGSPIGIGTNIYQFKGQIKDLNQTEIKNICKGE